MPWLSSGRRSPTPGASPPVPDEERQPLTREGGAAASATSSTSSMLLQRLRRAALGPAEDGADQTVAIRAIDVARDLARMGDSSPRGGGGGGGGGDGTGGGGGAAAAAGRFPARYPKIFLRA